MFDALLQDLRYAIRTLLSSPGFAAVAILSLALGIGANTAIFSLIDTVMLKYLPVNHPEELLNITMGGGDTSFTNPIWEQVRDRQDVFSGVFAYDTPRFNLATGGEARYAQGGFVSGEYFSTLGVHAVLGQTFTKGDDRRGCAGSAVLGYDFWQKQYGGSASVIDRTISLDSHSFRILGVVEPGFFGVDVGRAVDVFVPLCAEAIIHGERTMLDERSGWWLRLVARPKPGVSPKQAAARLKTLAPQIYTATLPDWDADGKASYLKNTLDIDPASKGLSNLRTEYRPALITLMVVVGVVLLIACANVANLLLARATVRQREIAIRLALGSGRGRLMRQLLTESLLLSLAGAALGVLFAQWGSRLLVRFLSSTNRAVFLDLTLDFRVLAFTAVVAIVTGLLFGLAPAWRGTRVSPQSAMKENSRGLTQGLGRLGLGKVLVMVQVALSLVLVVGAGLLIGTFRNLETLNPGFERDHVLMVNVDLRNANYPKERRAAVYEEMLEGLRAIPGVRSASSSNITPISGSGWNGRIRVEGFVPKNKRDDIVWFNGVSSRYFETMGTPFLAGRDFERRDGHGSPKVAIVNETLARKFFGDTNVVGRFYRSQRMLDLEAPTEIVGVVKDAKYRSLREENAATVYLPASLDDQPNLSTSYELLASGSAADLIPGVKAAMEQVNRNVALEFRTLAVQVAESLNRERLLATLSGFFGGLALLLATIGLYGVMSYSVARRRNEIGIRMALGAEQSRVLRMVLGEVALVVCAGLIVGTAAAIAATRLVVTFLYGLKATDPTTLALSAMVLGGVAALAGYLPARRASRLDPMVALREE